MKYPINFPVYYIGITRDPAYNIHNAGSKAKNDVENILSKNFSLLTYINERDFFSRQEKLQFLLTRTGLELLFKLFFCHRKGIVIFQYPIYGFFSVYNRAFKQYLKNNNVILLVHDVDALRWENEQAYKKTIEFFNEAGALILHNTRMINELKLHGLTAPCVNLEVFDYLLNDLPQKKCRLGSYIVFAGNLAKSKWINQIPKQNLEMKFCFYGDGLSQSMKNNINVVHKGSYPASEVPYKLEGNFGLIWDGDSLKTCNGKMGNYTRYNNPHKLSLYIAAGLPVIVWSEAAIADFVNKYRIGFAVNSILDIPNKIKQLTNSDYEVYLKNIKELQQKVTSGYFTKHALKQAIDIIEKKNHEDGQIVYG